MITFQTESLAAMLDELMPLLPLHWQEIALDQDKVPLDPQYWQYLEREKRGEVLLVTMRVDSKLCGYFIGFVAPGLHYKTCITLLMDIFWVHPEQRGHGQGFQLFKAVEEEARRRGVHRMLVGSKLHRDASWLFEKLGYRPIEMYYSTWLGG